METVCGFPSLQQFQETFSDTILIPLNLITHHFLFPVVTSLVNRVKMCVINFTIRENIQFLDSEAC